MNTPRVISLMARKGNVQDLANCYGIHESSGLPYPETSRRILQEMWRTLLSNGAMQLFLVEDRARPAGSRIVSFSATLFVTDEFCLQARLTLPPYLCVELARRYVSRQLPVLDREQVARANAADGLNVMMCFEGRAQHGFSPEQFLLLREKQKEAFHLALRGYRIKEFLTDPVGTETSQWMLDGGARLRRDYSSYFRKHRSPEPEPWQRPWLLGLTRKKRSRIRALISRVFLFTPHRGFTLAARNARSCSTR